MPRSGELELYVRLPSRSITADQLVCFVQVQFGKDVEVMHLNQKKLPGYNTGDRTFCFLRCRSRDDMNFLIRNMNDAIIGDWEEPLLVKEKREHYM